MKLTDYTSLYPFPLSRRILTFCNETEACGFANWDDSDDEVYLEFAEVEFCRMRIIREYERVTTGI